MSTADVYDLAVVVIVIISAIRGYHKGLIHQLGALISIIAGVVVSIQYTPTLAAQLPGSDNVRSASAFIILLLAVSLVVWAAVNLISQIITNLKLNSWNNQMGMLLGVVYGFFWAVALTFILLVYAAPEPVSQIVVDENGNQISQAPTNEPSFIMKSKSGPVLTTVALGIIDRIPQAGDNYKFFDYLREYLQRNANEIKESNPNLPKETFAPSAPSDEEEKPQLPLSVPL
ncbi:MAG: CvpA family protein [Thermoguttaceae bacterium]|nr:CvpA family protein [Thermoguttaceae bacterium]